MALFVALFLKYGAVKTALLCIRLGINCLIKLKLTSDFSRFFTIFHLTLKDKTGKNYSRIRYGLIFSYTSNSVERFGGETGGKETTWKI